ncbi:MAG TPA: efflux RND transporter permease subunit [Tepidisphaeraceae bacterium]|jgi:multidrug efflux pump subunit AcrB|nr:efflux RND transporter permease subunit [Tepidisphaeraceae bacterium]
MWIVRLALRRPYTFIVVAMLIAVVGILSIGIMQTDIFPQINIPVVSVIWSYQGLSPTEMQERITTVVERALTTTVSDIAHMESTSVRGISVIKIYFQPHAKVEGAVAQVTALCQTLVKPLPPGITPPLILQYNASDVPVIMISLGSNELSEQEISDLGNNFIRTQLVTVNGAAVPVPYGGKTRVVSVDLDPDALYTRGLSPQDVTNAMYTQNIVLPPGTAKMGSREYDIAIDSSPELLNDLNNIPIRYVNGATVYVRDVAFVHDGFQPQTNLVRRDGRHSALLPILTSGAASTLSVVKDVRKLMPTIQAGLPKSLKVDFLFDQSVFVRASIVGVVREGTIAAVLTGLMILLFLRSWRSTLIVATSIPLSILASIAMLYALRQTLNIMTLGGMALAVGILVDDATVEIENNHRHMDMGKPLRRAILDGAQEVATPAFVSTLSICIVFVPIFFLQGVGGFLFSPLAMAVVFAMLASYFLSRTLVPTMFLYLLAPEANAHRQRKQGNNENKDHAADPPQPDPNAAKPKKPPSIFRRVLDRIRNGMRPVTGPLGRFFTWVSDHFEKGFERLVNAYGSALAWAMEHAKLVMAVFLGFAFASLFLYPFVGRDFFPTVDAGQIRFHVRCPAGTRIEVSEQYFQGVEDYMRQVIPASEIDVVDDNIGLPNNINLALSDNVTASPADGEILIALKPKHHPVAGYLARLRDELPEHFPDLEFFTQPADIVTQILNFGLPSPIDIQISGPIAESEKNYSIAEKIKTDLIAVPGAVDVHVQQITASPRVMFDTNRVLAKQFGLAEQDIANSLSVSLTGSGTTATNFWLNYKNGVSYQVVVQTPQYRAASIDELNRTPISVVGQTSTQLLSNVSTFHHASTPLSLNHYNVQPVYDVLAGVQATDLGSVSTAVNKILRKYNGQLSKASKISVRGQVQSMTQSFFQMGIGICFAVLLVYLLMTVNFQSWLDPLIILMGLPGALAGILWALFATHTTISVPALMGCIMSIGVATSNSILMIVFANDQRDKAHGSHDAKTAAMLAGRTRLRPVMMTALAMLLGMLPMSLALGEGAEQNAPLGRAVIGGLAVATFYTLFFVPVTYSLMRTEPPKDFDAVADKEEKEE